MKSPPSSGTTHKPRASDILLRLIVIFICSALAPVAQNSPRSRVAYSFTIPIGIAVGYILAESDTTFADRMLARNISTRGKVSVGSVVTPPFITSAGIVIVLVTPSRRRAIVTAWAVLLSWCPYLVVLADAQLNYQFRWWEVAMVVPLCVCMVRSVPRDPSRCSKCGYDLSGISAAKCPECGEAISVGVPS